MSTPTPSGTTAQYLADRFTARELAEALARAEDRLADERVVAQRHAKALASIARGEWTKEGARLCAREALYGKDTP